MSAFDDADALVVLTKIKTFNNKQDDGDAICESWAQAFNIAHVTSVHDAVEAVVRHYATPHCNPWITSGNVIAGVRAIRDARIEAANVDIADLTEDVDPRDPVAYLATYRHRIKAIGDGATVLQANALPLPPEARHAAIDRRIRPVLTARGDA